MRRQAAAPPSSWHLISLPRRRVHWIRPRPFFVPRLLSGPRSRRLRQCSLCGGPSPLESHWRLFWGGDPSKRGSIRSRRRRLLAHYSLPIDSACHRLRDRRSRVSSARAWNDAHTAIGGPPASGLIVDGDPTRGELAAQIIRRPVVLTPLGHLPRLKHCHDLRLRQEAPLNPPYLPPRGRARIVSKVERTQLGRANGACSCPHSRGSSSGCSSSGGTSASVWCSLYRSAPARLSGCGVHIEDAAARVLLLAPAPGKCCQCGRRCR